MRNWSLESLRHLHMVTWLANSRAGIWAQVYLFPKSVTTLSPSRTSAAGHCRSQRGSKIAGRVLFVSWICPLSSCKPHSWLPCCDYLPLMDPFSWAATASLEFQFFSLESVILTHFYLELFSLLSCVPTSSAAQTWISHGHFMSTKLCIAFCFNTSLLFSFPFSWCILTKPPPTVTLLFCQVPTFKSILFFWGKESCPWAFSVS